LDVPWLGLLHDWSKLRPDEFFPYARYFYESDGSHRNIRDETGYYKPTDTGTDFDFAWLLHQKRNKHHWQWWILPEDEGGFKTFPMTNKYRREMLADWLGAGLANGTPDTGAWYRKHRDVVRLHPDTRRWIEQMLEVRDEAG
jgi:hypothetical protein